MTLARRRRRSPEFVSDSRGGSLQQMWRGEHLDLLRQLVGKTIYARGASVAHGLTGLVKQPVTKCASTACTDLEAESTANKID